MELSKIAKITNYLLKLMIGLGTLSLLFARSVVRRLLIAPQLIAPQKELFYTVFFIALILVVVFIVIQVSIIFTSLSNDSPFIRKNEMALKYIAIACEGIALLIFIQLILNTDVMALTSIIMILIFGIIGLCAYVFSQLFKMSVFLKEENEMTI